MDDETLRANQQIGLVVGEVRRLFEQVALALKTLDRLMGEQFPPWAPFDVAAAGAPTKSLASPRDWLITRIVRAYRCQTEGDQWLRAAAVCIEPHDSELEKVEPSVTVGHLRLAGPGLESRFNTNWIWYVFEGAERMRQHEPLFRKVPEEESAEEWLAYAFPLAHLTGPEALKTLIVQPLLLLADGQVTQAAEVLCREGVEWSWVDG